MINSSSINSSPINSAGNSTPAIPAIVGTIAEEVNVTSSDSSTLWELVQALSENVTLSALTPTGSYERSWSDDFTMNEAMTDNFVSVINDIFTLSDTLTPSANRTMVVDELFTINDKLLATLIGIISENITLVHTYSDLFKLIATLSEVINTSSDTITQADHKILIASAFTLSAILNLTIHAEVMLDTFTINETHVDIYQAAEALVELLTISDLPVNHVRISVISDDLFSINDEVATQASLSSLLSEDVVFLISFDDGTTTYQGFTMNPETYAVTTYDNYNFNSTTNFDGAYLLAGSSGLYSMDGDTDEGTYITSKVKTAAMDFGSSNLKQCPKMYLGINNDASLILRVSIDGAYTAQYQLDIDSDDLSTQIFDIGKGLKGRYWQFDLQTKNNSTFELDEIELFPIQWGRKQR